MKNCDGIRYVPVSDDDYPEVLAVLARRYPVPASSGAASAPSSGAARTWTDIYSHRLLAARVKPAQLEILELLAEHGADGKSPSNGALRSVAAKASGRTTISNRSLASHMAWISRYAIEVNGTNAGLFSASNGTYAMSKAVADAWQQARTASTP